MSAFFCVQFLKYLFFYLTDEDECNDDPSLCANGVCNNLDGVPYNCTCNPGYQDDGSGQACVGKIHQVKPQPF